MCVCVRLSAQLQHNTTLGFYSGLTCRTEREERTQEEKKSGRGGGQEVNNDLSASFNWDAVSVCVTSLHSSLITLIHVA